MERETTQDDPAGMVFDIKEFALYDGPGLRCTVFLKGCPLRCSWCHNPEGLDPRPETMRTALGERRVGVSRLSSELTERLMGYGPVFAGTAGGITLSGGEPLSQPEFTAAVLRRLRGRLHTVLQTSGFAPGDVFAATAPLADLVFFDFKLADPAAHRRFTGADNAPILDNLLRLDASGRPYRIRLPLIPGVTDTPDNQRGIRRIIAENLGRGELLGLDLLPYNRAAGGKYRAAGKIFAPGYDENREPNIDPDFFRDVVREVKVL